jgi:hypothetical protein
MSKGEFLSQTYRGSRLASRKFKDFVPTFYQKPINFLSKTPVIFIKNSGNFYQKPQYGCSFF